MRGHDTRLTLQTLAYVTKLYAELTAKHGAPTVGLQNQLVHFILADPDLRRAVEEWASTTSTEEASTKPSQRLPHNELYRRVREYLEKLG